MTPTKRKLVEKLYPKHGDPFFGYPYREEDCSLDELYAWNAEHHYLKETIHELDAKIIVEVGVFRGGSVIKMAEELKRKGDGCVIAIDTWLGDHMLFEHEGVMPWMKRMHGRAEIWKSFYANVFYHGLEGYVLPLHLDAFAGLRLLNGKHRGSIRIEADIVHIDASHVSPMPYIDASEAYYLLRKGGCVIVDDWIPNQQIIEHDASDFTGIFKDVSRFCAEKGLEIEHDTTRENKNKCRFFKK